MPLVCGLLALVRLWSISSIARSAAVAGTGAVELAMRFLVGFRLLQRGELVFGQDQTVLRHLRLRRLPPLGHGLRSWRTQTPRTPVGETRRPSLASSLAIRVYPTPAA